MKTVLFKGLGGWVVIDRRANQDVFEGTYLFCSEEEALAWLAEEGLQEVKDSEIDKE